MSKFYEFDQNNSGGSFDHDPASGIGCKVYIEADSVDAACDKAEAIGIYFNGIDDGRDCPCCGDRWGRPWRDGTDAPEMYGVALRAAEPGETPQEDWGINSYIHFADGTFAPAIEKGAEQ